MNAQQRRKLRRKLVREGNKVPGYLVPDFEAKNVVDRIAELKVDLGPQANTGDFFMPGEAEKTYQPGSVWRLNTTKYGPSYYGRKVTVISATDTTVMVQSPKRKSPLEVSVSELEAVRES